MRDSILMKTSSLVFTAWMPPYLKTISVSCIRIRSRISINEVINGIASIRLLFISGQGFKQIRLWHAGFERENKAAWMTLELKWLSGSSFRVPLLFTLWKIKWFGCTCLPAEGTMGTQYSIEKIVIGIVINYSMLSIVSSKYSSPFLSSNFLKIEVWDDLLLRYNV